MDQLPGILGVGIDVVEVEQIRNARFKDRVASYFLTESELQVLPKGSRLPEHLASRFALKEAVIKAVPEKLSPFDFMIEKAGSRPIVTFVSQSHQKHYLVHVSLTHTPHVASALAVAVRR